MQHHAGHSNAPLLCQYELFTEGSVSEQKLRAHVVLTTYESLARAQNVFKRVPRWEALVVDEAQRLKGGGSGLLWKALRGQRIGHTVLLTGGCSRPTLLALGRGVALADCRFAFSQERLSTTISMSSSTCFTSLYASRLCGRCLYHTLQTRSPQDPAQFGDLDGLHKKYETLTPELVAESVLCLLPRWSIACGNVS